MQVESVVVGDAEVDDRLGARGAATREALVNAAKHAGVGTVSLYAEVEPEEVDRVRPGPRRRLRPGAGRRGPARRARVDRRPDGAARRQGDDPQRRGDGTEVELTHGQEHHDRGRLAAGRADRARGQPVRVVLVDDHAMFRAGVRAELAADSGVEIVGEAGGVGEAVAVIGRTKPDVVLLDVHMPDGGGKAVLEQVQGQPDVRFLALSVSDAAEDVIGVIRAGARGYVTKTISGPDLGAAIRRVADGDAVFSPRLAGFVLDAFTRPESSRELDPELDQLTQREREVLRLLARGYAYKEIASELFISIKTVETHVSNVLRKLQLSNRYELSRWAADRRLV